MPDDEKPQGSDEMLREVQEWLGGEDGDEAAPAGRAAEAGEQPVSAADDEPGETEVEPQNAARAALARMVTGVVEFTRERPARGHSLWTANTADRWAATHNGTEVAVLTQSMRSAPEFGAGWRRATTVCEFMDGKRWEVETTALARPPKPGLFGLARRHYRARERRVMVRAREGVLLSAHLLAKPPGYLQEFVPYFVARLADGAQWVIPTRGGVMVFDAASGEAVATVTRERVTVHRATPWPVIAAAWHLTETDLELPGP